MTGNGRVCISVVEAARMLNISKNLAYQLAREGRLPGMIRLGDKRIVVSLWQLERLLKGDGTEGSPTVGVHHGA